MPKRSLVSSFLQLANPPSGVGGSGGTPWDGPIPYTSRVAVKVGVPLCMGMGRKGCLATGTNETLDDSEKTAHCRIVEVRIIGRVAISCQKVRWVLYF